MITPCLWLPIFIISHILAKPFRALHFKRAASCSRLSPSSDTLSQAGEGADRPDDTGFETNFCPIQILALKLILFFLYVHFPQVRNGQVFPVSRSSQRIQDIRPYQFTYPTSCMVLMPIHDSFSYLQNPLIIAQSLLIYSCSREQSAPG